MATAMKRPYTPRAFSRSVGTPVPFPTSLFTPGPMLLRSMPAIRPTVPCGDVPAILFAGLMPLVNPAAPEDPFVDSVAGYAKRPNRPHPSGDYLDPLPNPLASTPFCRTLQLYGCSAVGNAAYYRVRYAFNGGAPAPFTGISWPLYRVVGGILQTHWAAADAAGWYPIVNPADNWSPPNLLLEWNTSGYANGLYRLDVQIADAGKAVLATSATVGLRTDNSYPHGAVHRVALA